MLRTQTKIRQEARINRMESNRYGYTKEDQTTLRHEMQEYFWDEYAEYIAVTPMTAYERRLLRKWVSDGHSINESPGSKYLPDRYPPADFLETYREDREISRAVEGMTAEEKEAYLKSYIGWEEPTPEELAYIEVKEKGSDHLKCYIKNLQREMRHMWEFIWQEGLGTEAREFIDEHSDEDDPFEWHL